MKGVLVLALLLAGCEQQPYVKRPPDRYLATGTILLTTGKALPSWCPKEAVACAPMDGSRRVNTLDPCDYPGEKYAEPLCHDIAHAVGGYPADHPD